LAQGAKNLGVGIVECLLVTRQHMQAHSITSVARCRPPSLDAAPRSLVHCSKTVEEWPQVVAERAAIVPGSPLRRLFGTLADNPHYRTYWYGFQVTALVMLMQSVANGYLAFVLTRSATALGVMGLASSIPILIFSPAGGVLADRLEERQLLVITQVVQCLCSVIMGILLLTDRIEYWHLLVSSVITGMGYAVITPTRQAWMPHLVGSEAVASAVALNNAGLNASRITGPALAGLLIAIPWF